MIYCKCVEIPSYLHVISLNQNEAHIKTVIKKLEGELRKSEERFTETDNPDYDAFSKIEGSMKKHMEQRGENLMKNLLNELQDSKREMEEKLNHVMIQTKVTTNQCKMPHMKKMRLPLGYTLTFMKSWKKPRMQN